MPIEINELLIEVKVSNTSNQPAANTAVQPQSAVIEACVDQVMMVINTSKER